MAKLNVAISYLACNFRGKGNHMWLIYFFKPLPNQKKIIVIIKEKEDKRKREEFFFFFESRRKNYESRYFLTV